MLSLFANKIFFPDFEASIVDFKPSKPETPQIINSTDSKQKTSNKSSSSVI